MARALTILCLLKDSNRQFSTIFPHSNGCSCLWTERTSGSWRWEKQRSLNTNQRTMRDEELYTFPCSISFCRVSWNYAMNECIIHFIKYLSTYVKQKITFCFCEQCLLYLSNFAGDHPRVQPAVSATREKEKLSKLKIFSSCIYNKYALKLNICQKFAERRIFDMIKNKHGMNLSFHQPN